MEDRRVEVEVRILKACQKDFRSLGELAAALRMNKHTLRAHYVYPMVKRGVLVRSVPPPAKSTVRYKTASV